MSRDVYAWYRTSDLLLYSDEKRRRPYAKKYRNLPHRWRHILQSVFFAVIEYLTSLPTLTPTGHNFAQIKWHCRVGHSYGSLVWVNVPPSALEEKFTHLQYTHHMYKALVTILNFVPHRMNIHKDIVFLWGKIRNFLGHPHISTPSYGMKYWLIAIGIDVKQRACRFDFRGI